MKNKYFRILLLSGIIFTASANMHSQSTIVESSSTQVTTETYRILNLPNLSDLTPYADAMKEANFDSYRFIDKRRNLVFESGVVVELFSANELKEMGIAFDETKVTMNEFPQGYIAPTYKIAQGGKIVAVHTIQPKKK